MNNISVIGSGAWGTALAEVLSRAGRAVTLYARDPGLAETINKTGENDIYLAGTKIDSRIRATADPAAAVKTADIVLLVTPAQHMRGMLWQFKGLLPKGVPLINCAKGIEVGSGLLPSEIVEEIAPGHPYAVLSGPTFAHEVVRGLPSAVTLAAAHDEARLWAEALKSAALRPYLSDDVPGAEVAGALKNVIAIACGIVEGLKLGQNARAAVMTRGMAEIRRLGVRKGARAETFLGLSGIGDLTLTCNSMSSRNFSLGAELGQGRPLDDILGNRRTVAEGVATARAVALHADKLGVDMPICIGIDHILHRGAKIDDIVRELLSRDIRNESD